MVQYTVVERTEDAVEFEGGCDQKLFIWLHILGTSGPGAFPSNSRRYCSLDQRGLITDPWGVWICVSHLDDPTERQQRGNEMLDRSLGFCFLLSCTGTGIQNSTVQIIDFQPSATTQYSTVP